MLFPKQAIRSKTSGVMNKNISVMVLPQSDDFYMHLQVSSSKSVICLRAKCSRVIICNMNQKYIHVQTSLPGGFYNLTF